MLSLLIGGLVLFLYAITQLSETLQGVFSERAKSLVERYTRNVFTGLLVGTVLTIILDSSSAVIIITIVFINAGTISFRQAIGIIMGANIGTTFSSQLIALDIGAYSILPLFIGLGLLVFGPSQRLKTYGRILLYFGMLFFWAIHHGRISVTA